MPRGTWASVYRAVNWAGVFGERQQWVELAPLPQRLSTTCLHTYLSVDPRRILTLLIEASISSPAVVNPSYPGSSDLYPIRRQPPSFRLPGLQVLSVRIGVFDSTVHRSGRTSPTEPVLDLRTRISGDRSLIVALVVWTATVLSPTRLAQTSSSRFGFPQCALHLYP